MFTSGDILGKEIKKKKREKERRKLLNVVHFLVSNILQISVSFFQVFIMIKFNVDEFCVH